MLEFATYVPRRSLVLVGQVLMLPIRLIVWMVVNILVPILLLPETLWEAMEAQSERRRITSAARNAHHESMLQLVAANDRLLASFRHVLETIEEADHDLATFNPHFAESLEAAQTAFTAHQNALSQAATNVQREALAHNSIRRVS